MRENLDDSLELIWGHEGGYSTAKTDKGNYLNGKLVGTKFGITGKTLAAHRGVDKVTAAQVKALTIDEAEDIYRKSYWGPAGGDVLPAGLDYVAFDFGINSGPQTAVKKLQEVLRAAGLYGGKIDGWLGEESLRAVKDYPGGVQSLIRDYCDRRMAYLRSLKSKKTGFPANGRGWTIRVTGKDPEGKWPDQPGVLGNALAMASRGRLAPSKPADLPIGIADEAGAKAPPPEPNPWLKPDVLLPAGGAVATGAGTVITSGLDPIRLAFAIGIIVLVGLGAYYAFRRIQKMGAA